ncbi:hypothetical protein K474DRAFT_1680067 [Panus rudis PR-1116 ss-1]|nr:hypothetical protein K474DRAFT_1680067 [Panus rudis PR-1116 ss-1]
MCTLPEIEETSHTKPQAPMDWDTAWWGKAKSSKHIAESDYAAFWRKVFERGSPAPLQYCVNWERHGAMWNLKKGACAQAHAGYYCLDCFIMKPFLLKTHSKGPETCPSPPMYHLPNLCNLVQHRRPYLDHVENLVVRIRYAQHLLGHLCRCSNLSYTIPNSEWPVFNPATLNTGYYHGLLGFDPVWYGLVRLSAIVAIEQIRQSRWSLVGEPSRPSIPINYYPDSPHPPILHNMPIAVGTYVLLRREAHYMVAQYITNAGERGRIPFEVTANVGGRCTITAEIGDHDVTLNVDESLLREYKPQDTSTIVQQIGQGFNDVANEQWGPEWD